MRFFFFIPNKQFTQHLALFTIGVIVGAVLTTLAIGYQMEKIHNENSYLKVQLDEKENQIKALEDKVSEAKRWFIVKEIEIDLELPQRNFADEENLKIKIEEQVKDMLKNIRGKRVKELDPQVIWHIVDKRKIEALGYHFTLQVKGVLVSEKIIFYVYAKYIAPNQQEEPVIISVNVKKLNSETAKA
ncbi:MAG: hypothetical protein PWQ67_1465 [Clostridia bacterium]|jgi:hypothetical protein|nr:hypothetical protein [Clostridia bacterium]MDN5323011.1 hypothetical protein [Clostridia bacterium]